MFNGVGLAVSAQGDRFLVGALLGLPVLGFYSIVVLVTIVPVSMVFRIMGTMNMAAFHNALAAGESLTKRISSQPGCRHLLRPSILSILTLMNVVTRSLRCEFHSQPHATLSAGARSVFQNNSGRTFHIPLVVWQTNETGCRWQSFHNPRLCHRNSFH